MTVDFKVGAQTLSENLLHLAPTKQVHLPAVTLIPSLAPSDGGYTLKLTANAVARDVYVTFGNLDVIPSDNYFDLLPEETQEISLKTAATLQQVQAAMKVISLADAFDAKTSAPQDPPK
jgi:beta-mannosidase